ncbi:RNA-directed DNA polymerase from mobile element jockey [Trichonephila clavipes]|nr:RNA-directed DNA polymerase from mobile element jockey [Trichonephila clavipes]
MACIYRHPHGSINVTELDAILTHNNRTFLFGDFNAKHSSWNPGRSNANGNILSNWAVASAIYIIAPDTPTHFNHNAPSTIIDIGFAANFSHSNVFTVNELSSDHNPVIFDFVTNCQLPPLLQTLKTTNWIKFQEILHYNMPGNPKIENLDQAVQNFSNMISDAINTSTSTRISKTSHLRLPINIRELIKTKNRFHHHTVSTCLFADDSAALTQSVNLKYTIKTMQQFLVKLEKWLTDWRIAINVEKTQTIVFRKWGVIDPQTELTLFDDNILWVPVVRYLGLYLDSRLTFKNHIDYLSDKFWGRIALAISLIGRSSPLSLENKVILYKQILRPTITYGSPIWGAAAPTHTKRIQIIQNKILRIIANAPWYVRNSVILHGVIFTWSR